MITMACLVGQARHRRVRTGSTDAQSSPSGITCLAPTTEQHAGAYDLSLPEGRESFCIRERQTLWKEK